MKSYDNNKTPRRLRVPVLNLFDIYFYLDVDLIVSLLSSPNRSSSSSEDERLHPLRILHILINPRILGTESHSGAGLKLNIRCSYLGVMIVNCDYSACKSRHDVWVTRIIKLKRCCDNCEVKIRFLSFSVRRGLPGFRPVPVNRPLLIHLHNDAATRF